ncbi:MAG: choice-of-anchor Q domain-containing protein [Planctomycetota bacterium]|jgi:hypothetical protein
MYKLVCAVIVTVGVSAFAADADTIHVDDDNCPGPGDGSEQNPYCSIQTAIDDAGDGDEICVAAGIYYEMINLLGKAIILRSCDGPDVTTINAQGAGSVVTCTSGEGSGTVLDGFTITGGTGTYVEMPPDSGEFLEVGGGMYNVSASPTVTGCTFSGNAAGFGGGMYNVYSSSPTVIDCTFIGNSADRGGGMYNHIYNGSSLTLTGCTLSGNSATNGGGVFSAASGFSVFSNCVFWGDSGGEIVDFGSLLSVSYSDVQDGWPGTGNIDADPLFVDPDNADLRLSPDSPCIDAGHNWAIAGRTDTDLDGNPRCVHAPIDPHSGCGIPAIVDMGAYESQDGTAFDIRFADIDGDGCVDIVDTVNVLADWGACPDACCMSDLDMDGFVGITDFLLVLAHWG